jgi:hypothetical protein
MPGKASAVSIYSHGDKEKVEILVVMGGEAAHHNQNFFYLVLAV